MSGIIDMYPTLDEPEISEGSSIHMEVLDEVNEETEENEHDDSAEEKMSGIFGTWLFFLVSM